MKTNKWAPLTGWLATVAAAVGMAWATPDESGLLGKLPVLSVKTLDQRHLVLPQHLPSDRTLALVVFRKEQKAEVQSWVDGLGLHQNPSIAWLKLPVLDDPGSDHQRREVEERLLARHQAATERARLVPVFTNRDAFARSAGLSGAEHASALVLDRGGNVLARAEGLFDEAKGQALLETLLSAGE